MTQQGRFFYRSSPLPPPASIAVHSLGIGERMPPGSIRHGGSGRLYLFMFFHDEAFLNPGEKGATPAKGGSIFWDPSALHHYGNLDRHWVHSWINLSGSLVDERFAEFHPRANALFFADTGSIFLKYLQLLYDELHSHVVPDTGMLDGILTLWLREITRVSGREMSALPACLGAARAFVEAHLHQPLSLEQLAAAAHLSPSRFSAVFRRHFGTSPMHFVQRMKMKRAEMLLTHENLAVFQVAALCGYDDPYHFSKRFHLHAGISPTDYRNSLRRR